MLADQRTSPAGNVIDQERLGSTLGDSKWAPSPAELDGASLGHNF